MSTENSCLVSEKIHLTKIKIIAPAAHATLWRSFSTLKRVKKSTFFTMTKSRQNHLLMILIFNEELDEISIKPITNKLIKEKKSSIATFRLHQSSICLLYFIYCYCLISFLSMFSFNNPPPPSPLKSAENCKVFFWLLGVLKRNIGRKWLMFPRGVFHEVCTKPSVDFWTLVSPCTLYVHFELLQPPRTIRV